MDKIHVCFVCSDNLGRSVTAEYCLRDYLEQSGITDIAVSSAGTNAHSDITGFSLRHFDELKAYGYHPKA
jgi:protein-tyrosine-phosphatase